MHFDLTEDHKMIQQMARDFAKNEIRPKARAWDEQHEFPADIVKKMGELGLMGMMVPEQWGGAGLDPIAYALAIEEISHGDAGCGVIMSVNNSLVCDPLLHFANDAQKEMFLKPLASGQKLGCFALSEPETGSDATNQHTLCKRDGDNWILNGTKNWITNGPQADTCVVFASFDRALKGKGINAFVLPMKHPGVSCGKPENKLGIRSSGTCSIIFEDAVIPDAWKLGADGDGFKIAMHTLDGGRIGIAAQALGISRAALEAALTYSLERKAFGKPIAEIQTLQNYLADMATQLDAARLLTHRAAWLKGQHKRYSKEAAMAKLFAADASAFITTKAIQIHGGYGYVVEYDVERFFRDARITEIYEGTSEIQRLVIARSVLKEAAG
jgi:butyryl-CoA dehydrogenase